MYKEKREKLGKWPRREKSKKGKEEVRNGGTQIEAREEQESMTADQIIEEREKQKRGGKR